MTSDDRTSALAGAQPDAAGRMSAPRFDATGDPEPTGPLPLGGTAQATADTHRMLGGRYRLEERIASGGMASVWRAVDEVLARTVAVKLLHDHLAADSDFRERFRREAISAARLTHPGIVSLYDTGADGDRVFLVMEFVDGQTLRDALGSQGALPAGQAAQIGERVARALAYAHSRGLIHRDVKPANILIAADGTVKVADFGIAKADQADDLTKTGMVLGTAAYVAPEQILARPVDGQVDQYALGCVLFEALTGRQPFKAETAVATAAQRLEREAPSAGEWRTDIPRALAETVVRAMAREPSDRWPDLGAMADALALHADTGVTTVALPPRPVAPPRQLEQEPTRVRATGPEPDHVPPPRRRVPIWLMLVITLLVGAGVAVALRAPGIPGMVEADPTEQPSASTRPTPHASAESSSTPSRVVRLTTSSLAVSDPAGDGENDAQLPLMIDGNENTGWATEGYFEPEFGNLKPGVGFTIDLGEVRKVSEVSFAGAVEGATVELRASTSRISSAEDAELLDSFEELPSDGSFEFDPVEARYLLIWVTGHLGSDGAGNFRAGFGEIDIVAS